MKIKNLPYLIVIGLLLVLTGLMGASALMASDSPGVDDGVEVSPHKKFFDSSDHPFKTGMKKNFSKEGMIKRFESKLDGAVEDGTITEEQKDAIVLRKTEMIEKFKELKDLPPEEAKLEIKKLKEEFRLWAEENDIDLNALCRGYGKKGDRHFKGNSGSVEPGSLGSI